MLPNDAIVHLHDLPENKICVRLPRNIGKEMITTALGITKSRYRLAQIIGVKPVNIYDFEKYRFTSITFSFIRKISEFLIANGFDKFSLDNIESKIEMIKAKFLGNIILSPKFPIDFNCKEGAEIIAAIMFDGGLSAKGYPFYTNNERFLIDKIINNIQKIVGRVKYNMRKSHPNTFMVMFPKTVGYILTSLGALSGRKVFTNPPVPDFILNGDIEIRKAFLQQAFDDEGSVHPGKSGRSIQLNQYHNSKNEPPQRLSELKKLIESFYIAVNGPYGPIARHISKDGILTYGWMIEISNQANIRKFSGLIGFSLPRKQEKLTQLLNSYKLPPRFRDGSRLEEVLKVCEELKAQNQKITNKNVADKLRRDSVYMSELTSQLVDQGKLRIVRGKSPLEGTKRGFASKEFEVMR